MSTCTLFIVRHAEKQQLAGEKNPPLSERGQQRARALADRLASSGIVELHASQYQRTQLTLQPLAERLALPIQIYEAGAGTALIEHLLDRPCPGPVIVAGHSNTLPELLRAAGIPETASEFDESRYGELFIVSRRLDGTQWQASLQIERFGD